MLPALAAPGLIEVNVGAGFDAVKSFMVISSKLMRLVPASVLRISNRIAPAIFTVKLCILKVVALVVMVAPA